MALILEKLLIAACHLVIFPNEEGAAHAAVSDGEQRGGTGGLGGPNSLSAGLTVRAHLLGDARPSCAGDRTHLQGADLGGSCIVLHRLRKAMRLGAR